MGIDLSPLNSIMVIIIIQNYFVQYTADTGNVSTINNTYLNHSATTSSPEMSSSNATGMNAISITNSTKTQEKIPLYIGGIFSLGGLWDGSGILPAVEMGLDHINNRVDILPEYELRMVWNDSQVGFCFVLFVSRYVCLFRLFVCLFVSLFCSVLFCSVCFSKELIFVYFQHA